MLTLLLAGSGVIHGDSSKAAERRGERDAARFNVIVVVVVVVPLTFQGRRTV